MPVWQSVCVCVCVVLTRKYNVYDGESITTLFSYRGNNTSRNRITCDAVGMMPRRDRAVRNSVYSKRAEQSNLWFSGPGWCEIVFHQSRCEWAEGERERERERRTQYKRAFITLYRTVEPIHRTHFTTTANRLANNKILKFTGPVHGYYNIYL